MTPNHLLRAAARSWENAGHPSRAAERYSQAHAWAEAGRCWAEAERPVDAADAYARAGELIHEARQWLSSQWPESARSSYERALKKELGACAEVEALLGLGEIDQAVQCAFVAASEDGRSVDALRALARLAVTRGRPDLAARAWERAIAWSPASAGEIFEDWEGGASWNRSLGWERPTAGSPGWPSRAFRGVRLELVWEEKLGQMMYGNRALAWSSDGRRFAAAKNEGDLVLGDLTGGKIRHQSVEMEAISVAFVPESSSVLVGCKGGQVVRVDASGVVEDIEVLRMPDEVWAVAFSPQADRIGISSRFEATGGAFLRVWSWASNSPGEVLREKEVPGGNTNPTCAWSSDGRSLAWCPGPWSRDTVSNGLYLFSEAGTRCVSVAHRNGVNGIAFSPNGSHLVTASLDRKLTVRDAQTGESVAPPWNCAQRLLTVVLHPHAALVAAGGTEDIGVGYGRPSRLYLFRFSQGDSPHLEVVQESATETAMKSLAFSPDGEHLMMSTRERLSLFRVHLT